VKPKPKKKSNRNNPAISITMPKEAFDHLMKRSKEPLFGGKPSHVLKYLILADAGLLNGANGH